MPEQPAAWYLSIRIAKAIGLLLFNTATYSNELWNIILQAEEEVIQ